MAGARASFERHQCGNNREKIGQWIFQEDQCDTKELMRYSQPDTSTELMYGKHWN